MKYLSLFSGIGGFELGIQSAWSELAEQGLRAEGGRLQGFPDGWTRYGGGAAPTTPHTRKIEEVYGPDFSATEMSDTQRYKMCGNAVTVNVIEAIMREFRCI